MATNYPSGYDSLNNPAASDPLDSSGTPHSSQHTNANDAIEAIQATLGLSPQGSYITVSERIYEMGNESSVAAAAASAAAAADSETAAAASATSAASSAASVDATATTAVEFRQFAADGSVLANLPARVHPAEQLLKQAVWWIDAAHSSASGQSVSNLGWGGSALDARVGSTGSADSNDPKFLDWDGENYVYLPGVSGNYLSVPDEASLDITGDIDIRVRVAMDDWTPAAPQNLIAKYNTGTNSRSWELFVFTDGKLGINWSTDGASGTVVTKYSSVATGITDAAAKWVRVTLDVDPGTIKFFTSDDGSSWAQLGTDVSAGGVTSIFSGSSIVSVGARADGTTAPAAGSFYRVQVLNGIDGTPVLDVDCSQITSGADTSFTALTGQTVTINRSTSGRKSVAVTHPCWLFGTDDYMEVADNALLDFGASDSFTVLAVVRQWATLSGGLMMVTKNDNTTGVSLTTNRFIITEGGVNTLTASDLPTSGDLTVVTGIRTSNGSKSIVKYEDAVAGASVTDTTTNSLATNAPLRVGSVSTSVGSLLNGELVAAAIFRRALTSGEITTLSNYFAGRVA